MDINNIELLIEKLFLFYNVQTISALAEKMGTSQSVISKWKKRKSISAIKKKCMQLGIYEDIFGNMVTQVGGNISGNNNDIIQNANNSQVKKIKESEELLSAEEIFILSKYKEAESRGERTEFINYVLNYKGNN